MYVYCRSGHSVTMLAVVVCVTYLAVMNFYTTLYCTVPSASDNFAEGNVSDCCCCHNSQKFVHDNYQGQYKFYAFKGDYPPKAFCFQVCQ